MSEKIRNIAIIAHVDHGKTTLIDSMMKQSGVFRDNQSVDERLMDTGDLEKERGITILAKPTSIEWKGITLNIIDTPGHADFGGEVERVLSMADGVILLVDASEGPMPQTKFVLAKALKQNLLPIVVINKVDKKDSRIDKVVDEVFDLFIALEANDNQLDFPILYSSGRDGWCVKDLNDEKQNLDPLFEKIIDYVSKPQNDHTKPFAMLASLLDFDPYLGRCLIGKVIQGSVKVNEYVKAINLQNNKIDSGRLTKLLRFQGMKKIPVERLCEGDVGYVVTNIKKVSEISVGDTITNKNDPATNPLPGYQPIKPMVFSGMYPIDSQDYEDLRTSLEKLQLNDASLTFSPESSVALGFGFRCGFLGMLHMEIIQERLEREFEMNVITTCLL